MRHSPSNIEVILWCYYSPHPHPRWHAPVVQQALSQFLLEGLIYPDNGGPIGVHYCTDKGKAWVEMICATPFPQQVWVDPRDNQPVIYP